MDLLNKNLAVIQNMSDDQILKNIHFNKMPELMEPTEFFIHQLHTRLDEGVNNCFINDGEKEDYDDEIMNLESRIDEYKESISEAIAELRLLKVRFTPVEPDDFHKKIDNIIHALGATT